MNHLVSDEQRNGWIEGAEALGESAGREAASYVVQGLGSDMAKCWGMLRRLRAGVDVADSLPRLPNLSGEFADDLNPLRLVTTIAGDSVDPDLIIDDLCAAFENGVDESFVIACEAELAKYCGDYSGWMPGARVKTTDDGREGTVIKTWANGSWYEVKLDNGETLKFTDDSLAAGTLPAVEDEPADIASVAKIGADHFDSRRRRTSGEQYACLEDDAPDWIEEAVKDAHDGKLPDDYVYETAREAFFHIYAWEDDADDMRSEFCDVEAGYKELTDWLGSHLDRFGYCDQAAEEGLISAEGSMSDSSDGRDVYRARDRI